MGPEPVGAVVVGTRVAAMLIRSHWLDSDGAQMISSVPAARHAPYARLKSDCWGPTNAFSSRAKSHFITNDGEASAGHHRFPGVAAQDPNNAGTLEY